MTSHPVGHPQAREQSVRFSEQLGSFCRRNFSWLLAIALGLLLLQDVFGAHGLVAMRRSQKESERIQKEIDRINGENSRLEGNVKQLKTDPQSIEKIAREEMGLARPGEYIFKLPASTNDPTARPAQPTPGGQKQP